MIVLNKLEILRITALAAGDVDIIVSYSMTDNGNTLKYSAYETLEGIGSVDIACNETIYNNENPSGEARTIEYISITNRSAVTQTIEIDVVKYNSVTLGRVYQFSFEENDTKVFNGSFWTTGEFGAQGDTGPAGAAGPAGVDGADGPAGPAPSGTGLVSVTAGVLDTPSILPANLALLNAANTFTAAQTISVAGAASTPAVRISGTIFTGGTGTTTKPQFLIEPSGTTSTGWSTSGTMVGVNAPSGFAGNLFDFKVNDSTSSRIYGTANGTLVCSNFAVVSNSAGISLGVSSDVFIVRDSAFTLQIGSDASSPQANTFKGPDARAGTDTNTAGGILNIAAGRGTGTAAGGELRLQTSEPTSSGTAAGTLTTRLAISGTAITASKAVVLPEYTLAQLDALTGKTTNMVAVCTDATAPTYLTAITGGGSVRCPAYYNGTAWVAH